LEVVGVDMECELLWIDRELSLSERQCSQQKRRHECTAMRQFGTADVAHIFLRSLVLLFELE